MSKALKLKNLALAFTAAAALTACADFTNQRAMDNPDLDPDPQEGINRVMFSIHNAIDTVLLKPVAYVYRAVMPEFGRNAVSNFVHNLGSPVFMANSVLQGDVDNSAAVFWRFTLNTTIGIGGLFDVADTAGIQARDADFGQTLAVWGVGSGPYTFIPIIGPGTTRDTFGRIVDIVWNPSVWARESWYSYAQFGITVVDRRAANYTLIDDIFRTSLDPYATFRSGYLQKRTSDIRKAKDVHFTPKPPAQ